MSDKDFFEALNTPAEPRPASTGKREYVKKDISGQQVAIIKRAEITDNKTGGRRVSFQLYFPAFNQTEFDNVQMSEAAAGVLGGKLRIVMGLSDGQSLGINSEFDLLEVLEQAEGGKLKLGVKKNGEYWTFYWNSFTPAEQEADDDSDVPF